MIKNSFSGINKYVWILAASMLINRTGSMVIAFMSLYCINELGFSMTQAGFVMTAYGFGSIIGSYAGGWIVDRKGSYDVILFTLFVSGVLLLPLIFIKNYYAILVLIFFYSLIADAFRPANTVAVSNLATEETRTRSISLMRLAINLGFAIGPAIGGLMAVTVGFKWIFLVDSLSSIGAGVLLLFYLPKNKITNSLEKIKKPITKSSSAFFDFKFMIFLILVSLYATFFFQLFASVPVFFDKQFHYAADTIGYLLGLNGLLVVLLEMPIIYSIENHQNKGLLIAFGCMMMAIAYFLLGLNSPLLIVSVIYTLFITLSEIFAMPIMMNYVLTKPLKERQGQYVALYSVAYGIAHIVAPSAGLGIAERFGFIPMYIGTAVASILLGSFFIYFLNPRITTKSIGIHELR